MFSRRHERAEVETPVPGRDAERKLCAFCSKFELLKLVILLVAISLAASAQAEERGLRVCADPNNLPFSYRRGEGFENRIANLIGREFGAKIDYTWWRNAADCANTMGQGLCDLIIGVPPGPNASAHVPG